MTILQFMASLLTFSPDSVVLFEGPDGWLKLDESVKPQAGKIGGKPCVILTVKVPDE